MPLTGKQMLKKFLNAGWIIDRINGSHHVLVKGEKSVTIPVHNKDLHKGLEQRLLKEGGFK